MPGRILSSFSTAFLSPLSNAKRPQISVEQAVEQTIRNQQPEYIPQLFKFAQIVAATNKNTVKYATTGTLKKFWATWQEQDNRLLK